MTPARWVYAALAAYALGFVLFWPRALLIVDEDRYVSQAVAFAGGGRTIAGRGILFPPVSTPSISDYPPGTSLAQVPLVWLGGWRMAAVLSLLALIAATLATMRWLRANGASEGFALLVPGFLGAAFFGRVAMSDVPTMALVAVAGWLLWQSRDRAPTSFLGGFVAGAVLLFREPVVLLVGPLVIGALLRRQCVRRAVAGGFVAGVAIRLAASALVFGSSWYVRDPQIAFTVSSLGHTVPVYGLILLVLLPGGALLPISYRGPRRLELTLAVGLYVALFLFYDYDSIAMNGRVKGVILASRFMAPALPLLALMAADAWPRWYARLAGDRLPHRRVAAAAGVAVAVVAFAVHPLAWFQEREAIAIREALFAHTRSDTPVITNADATLKYFSPAYGARLLILRRDLLRDSLVSFSRRYGTLSVAFFDRLDSPAFREDALANGRFLTDVTAACDVRPNFRRDVATGRLHVYELSGCR